MMRIGMLLAAVIIAAAMPLPMCMGDEPGGRPYAQQVSDNIARLQADSARDRASAAEALGFLRAFTAEDALLACLSDASSDVRREAALALAWCGGRKSVPRLMAVLGNDNWSVAQSAWVALTNLTAKEFPFDALADAETRNKQKEAWVDWWRGVPADRPPKELLEVPGIPYPSGLAFGCPVKASTTYKGPPGVLTDGATSGGFWQTKNVPFPQSVTVDLRKPTKIGHVTVYQYGRGFCMTDYALSTSIDGKNFDVIRRSKGRTSPKLGMTFEPRPARFVRVTSYSSERSIYPTTFFEIDVRAKAPVPEDETIGGLRRFQERSLRALGALGGKGAAEAVMNFMEPMRERQARLPREQYVVLQAGMRALGRLRDPATVPWLATWLTHTQMARHAAEALGDVGDSSAVGPLIDAYPDYSCGLKGQKPEKLPRDDDMAYPHLDRMYHTPYAIAFALARLPLNDPADLDGLRRISPYLLANLPQDHDGAMLYEPEVGMRLTAYLLDKAGMRQEACEAAFEKLGQKRRVAKPPDAPALPVLNDGQVATWLPALCEDTADIPRLAELLGSENGWVSLNAAKALGYIGDEACIEPLAEALADAKPEADYGYSPKFIDEEYNDPAPRQREAMCRALGRLRAKGHVDMLASIMNDRKSVLEVRYAAAAALADIATPSALACLREAAGNHSFDTVRHLAREKLWLTGSWKGEREDRRGTSASLGRAESPSASQLPASPDAVVFIKGDNDLPNHFQNDRWRQTYVTTDTGPTYRPGRNIYVLRPVRPDGEVTPLTNFVDGYVADCEVSWDGRRVLFCRRGEEDPWWHVFEMNADGTGMTQITHGPYHDVQPAYLPDGRIVFSSSRIGTRDEYHAYLCTALYVMNRDGSNMHPIAMNFGRDNEPSILPDGRIVFSRLEVFYSRLKTELTMHGVHPDGTRDVVLYGPERRKFWRQLKVGMHGDDYASNVMETHRILRMTQPQGLPDGRIVCSTQGGLALVGPERTTEEVITSDFNRAYTTPFPLPDGRMMCASTIKTKEKGKVDLGLYFVDTETGELTLIYNDPKTADYEARPLMARRRPPIRPESGGRREFTGRFACMTTKATQEDGVATNGRLVRVIEGLPVVSRHSTQTNPWPVWKNHGGAVARVLGTVPLASDGSFNVEIPADRLVHFQVLDSNRRVVGNQLTWIYTRPGERRSCIGCHERPDSTPPRTPQPQALEVPPIRCLPSGNDFRYRAKAWLKGHLPPEVEERTRTARAVNLLAR